MQKDFMSMAQGQAAPEEVIEQEDEMEGMAFSSEDFETMGMPGGDDVDSIKQRIMMLLEQTGLMEAFSDPASKQQLATLIDELAQAMVSQDLEKIQSNKLFQLIQTTMEESGGLEQLQGGQGGEMPQGEQGVTDFASMMPPTPGGGMSGR